MDTHVPAPSIKRWRITLPGEHLETVAGTKMVINEAGALVVIDGRDPVRVIPAGRWLDCELIA